MKRNVGSTAKHSKVYLECDKLTFGKYKGRSVIEIIVSDPQYILWVSENISYVKFNEETIKRAAVRAKQKEDDYYRRKRQIDYDDEPLTSNILGL